MKSAFSFINLKISLKCLIYFKEIKNYLSKAMRSWVFLLLLLFPIAGYCITLYMCIYVAVVFKGGNTAGLIW